MSFTAGRNILSAGGLQDFLSALHPVGVVAVNRKQNAAVLHAAFVTQSFAIPEFPFRNQRSHDPSGNAYRARARKPHGHNGALPQAAARYRGWLTGQFLLTSNHNPADDSAGSSPSGCALRSFRILFESEILRSHVIGEKSGNIGVAEPGAAQSINAFFSGGASGIDTEDRRVFPDMGRSPFLSGAAAPAPRKSESRYRPYRKYWPASPQSYGQYGAHCRAHASR